MNKILLQLREDHQHISELLILLHDEMTSVDAGDEFDFKLTLGILDYINNQPDVFHRPLEQELFGYVRPYGRFEKLTDSLWHEHAKLSMQTKECHWLFVKWSREGELFDRNRMFEVGRNYIETQRRHIAVEESELFPAATEFLSDANWKAVTDQASSAVPVDDPLFGPTVIERYRGIRRKILQKLN